MTTYKTFKTSLSKCDVSVLITSSEIFNRVSVGKRNRTKHYFFKQFDTLNEAIESYKDSELVSYLRSINSNSILPTSID